VHADSFRVLRADSSAIRVAAESMIALQRAGHDFVKQYAWPHPIYDSVLDDAGAAGGRRGAAARDRWVRRIRRSPHSAAVWELLRPFLAFSILNPYAPDSTGRNAFHGVMSGLAPAVEPGDMLMRFAQEADVPLVTGTDVGSQGWRATDKPGFALHAEFRDGRRGGPDTDRSLARRHA
jgi:hypothetical protein